MNITFLNLKTISLKTPTIDILQDTLKEIVKQVIDAQKESDEMFVQLKTTRLGWKKHNKNKK